MSVKYFVAEVYNEERTYYDAVGPLFNSFEDAFAYWEQVLEDAEDNEEDVEFIRGNYKILGINLYDPLNPPVKTKLSDWY